ncbi:MAG: GIY-YIG nuclease family protein [Ignavibacteriales bacterium]|nr:GIY-YIG nuclease family protein [Ignavibacteriales bacterium]
MKKEINIIEIPFEEVEYSVFDFETTGTRAKFENVIQIGIVKIKNGKIIDTFSSFINPGKPIPYFITTLTGITNSDVANAPFFDEVYYKIKEFVGDSILVAHNLPFDYSFLKCECERNELQVLQNHGICTLKLARKLFPNAPSKSLGNLTRHLNIKHRNIHTGLGDANATAKIFLKMFPLLRDNFGIDTINDLILFQSSPSSTNPFRIIKKKLVDDLSRLPSLPGVYFFKDAKGKIIYIGKAKSLKDRVRNYFMSNAIRKAKKIVQAASSIDFQVTNSELSALIAETELIKIHNPKFNTMLKSYPNNYFIKIKNDLYPSVDSASQFDFDGNDYYGPYPNRETAKRIKEIVDKTFQLRECTNKELMKKRKCYLHDIKRCLAPCIIEDRITYLTELDKVHEFLSGHNQSAIDRLLNKMKLLSEGKKYEEAAEVRDIVQNILNQIHKSSILSEPLNKAKVLVEINSAPNREYLLLIDGKVVFKNFFLENHSEFDSLIEDFFEGTIFNQTKISQTNLERLKIALSWLVKNKTQIKIHYLNNFKTKEELAKVMIFK